MRETRLIIVLLGAPVFMVVLYAGFVSSISLDGEAAPGTRFGEAEPFGPALYSQTDFFYKIPVFTACWTDTRAGTILKNIEE